MRAQWKRLGASGVLAASLIACAPAFAQTTDGPLGATVDGLRAAGRQLSPALRAAALDTEAASAKASGADALDDPTISDSYQYYKDPGVFSAHTVMVSQSFPLWGKRSLRREAALADVDAARGRERAAQDEIDEKIKVAAVVRLAPTNRAEHANIPRAVSGRDAINVLTLARCEE